MPLIGDSSTATVVDPTSASGTAKAKLDEELNQFLNLLVTQLKNQDPLDPMDANEFTSQLVQFASVEQQIYQNANLEKLLNISQTSQVASMVDFIGNTVESAGNVVPLENGEAKFTYILYSKADKVNITVQNAEGLTVFTTEGVLDEGKHEFIWDGTNPSGTAQPDGAYSVTVTAQDREDNLQDVGQTVYGRVTGAGAEDGLVSLYMDDIVFGLDKVLSIHENTTTTVN
ncbi:MAG: flagellar hook assembly protein FlgD [Alphaproteobacteria bacterium]